MQWCRNFFAMKLLRTYFESCASIVQAVVSARPTAVSTKPVNRRDAVRSRNPSKSTLAHDAVAAAVSHKHHSIISVGAGLIQFVYKSHSRLATELTLDTVLCSPWFQRAFSINVCLCVCASVCACENV